jgi:hypothetical protein
MSNRANIELILEARKKKLADFAAKLLKDR